MLIVTIEKECGSKTGIFLKNDEHATKKRGGNQLTKGRACTRNNHCFKSSSLADGCYDTCMIWNPTGTVKPYLVASRDMNARLSQLDMSLTT